MLTPLLVFVIITSLVQNVVHGANKTSESDETVKITSPEVTPFLFRTPAEPAVMPATRPVSFGSAPYWEHGTQTLYYVSLFGKSLLRRAGGSQFKSKLDGMPTFIIPIEGEPNHFAVGLERKVVEVEWLGGDDGAKVIRTIAEVNMEHPDNRLSHGKADPRGRLFAGTMPADPNSKKNRGSLYRFDADGAPHKLLANIGTARGLCWDRARSVFYFIDSVDSIRRYDYDEKTGDISNPKTVFAMQGHEYIVAITESYGAVTQTYLDSAERYVAALIEGPHKAGRQGDRQEYDDGGSQVDQDDKIESHDVDERGLLDYDQNSKEYDQDGKEYVQDGKDYDQDGKDYDQESKDYDQDSKDYNQDSKGYEGGRRSAFQGYAQAVPQSSRQDYSPDIPQDNIAGDPQDTTPDIPQDNIPGDPQDTTPGGPQENSPNGPQDFAPGSPQGYISEGSQEYAPGGPPVFAPGGPQDFATGYAQGQNGRRSTVVRKKLSGVLDGMTIDTDGNLWVANYNGSMVLKIDPKKGKLLKVVSMPVSLVTSVTFGGPELRLLYVTSAAISSKGHTQENSPAGATFSVSFTGAKGDPDNKVTFNHRRTESSNGTKKEANKVLK